MRIGAPGGDFVLEGAASLAKLRNWITRIRDTHCPHLSQSALANLHLVCTELAANALEHADGPHVVHLRCDKGGHSVLVEVDDASPDSVLTPGRSSTSQFGGRGLAIIGSLASWGVRRGAHGKTLWAELRTATP